MVVAFAETVTDPEAAVARVRPGFGVRGKDALTTGDLLAPRAGLIAPDADVELGEPFDEHRLTDGSRRGRGGSGLGGQEAVPRMKAPACSSARIASGRKGQKRWKPWVFTG